ncbi:MAG: MGMT family protein [Pseudomonadales bacterium]|nr:MGMT family protein [Pseudomonadales bacterium]
MRVNSQGEIFALEKIEAFQGNVWQVVHMIPRGKVATYGQIAAMAGSPRHARMVGRILSRLPTGSRLPWHRVIASQGRITHPNADAQRRKLEAEGITLVNGRVNLRLYGWEP